MAYDDERRYLIKRMKEIRIVKGMSMQAVADIANMDRANYSRIESGISTEIYFSTLCRIAEALDVAPGELIRNS